MQIIIFFATFSLFLSMYNGQTKNSSALVGKYFINTASCLPSCTLKQYSTFLIEQDGQTNRLKIKGLTPYTSTVGGDFPEPQILDKSCKYQTFIVDSNQKSSDIIVEVPSEDSCYLVEKSDYWHCGKLGSTSEKKNQVQFNQTKSEYMINLQIKWYQSQYLTAKPKSNQLEQCLINAVKIFPNEDARYIVGKAVVRHSYCQACNWHKKDLEIKLQGEEKNRVTITGTTITFFQDECDSKMSEKADCYLKIISDNYYILYACNGGWYVDRYEPVEVKKDKEYIIISWNKAKNCYAKAKITSQYKFKVVDTSKSKIENEKLITSEKVLETPKVSSKNERYGLNLIGNFILAFAIFLIM